ncbi:LysR family transcriptional regulator [Jannaschia sp. LMIT008]|uniref:LysR family transcriptional regulator n=1 Tax=Jannaschia maritima TaxID=3032585 RepID=UPI0028125C40|nr:LysR family transcriptional regulator [Jannaschia sp. LMIT008]
MKRINVTLSDFRAIVAIAETGTFRAAAEALGLSASALSRQVTALERRQGTRLFDRDTRNVAPTASGLAFLRAAERAIGATEDGMRDFEDFLAARNGRLTIAGLPSVTAGLLPAVLRRFAARHPDVDLRIMDGLSDGVLEAVEGGVADLGFAAGTVSTRRRLDFQPLMNDPFVAVGTPDGPLAEDRRYDWAEIAAMPFIAMAKGTSVRELVDGACLRIGVELSPRFEASHLATAGALVAADLGVTALPTLTLPVLNMTVLVRREIEGFGAMRRVGLVKRSGRTLPPAAAAFIGLMRSGWTGSHAGPVP